MFAVEWEEPPRNRWNRWAELDVARDALVECEREIARIRARQMEILNWAERRHAERADRFRSIEEWVAAEVDVAPATARDMMAMARHWSGDDEVCVRMSSGDDTFDRSVATVALMAAGGTDDDVAESRHRDLAGVRRQVAAVRRVTRTDEKQAARKRFLKIEPTMDNTAWRISGLATAVDGAVIAKALEARGDELTRGLGPLRPDLGKRLVDALTTLAMDSLDGEGTRADRHGAAADTVTGSTGSGGLGGITIFVDAARAEATSGEVGAAVAAGPRVGPGALQRILCGGTVGIVALDELGNPVRASRNSRRIPPAVRAFVLHRDGGCVMAGCRSRYRLEPHHIHPYARLGDHDPSNLVTLCWFHHHIAIHLFEHHIDPESPPLARRFLRPGQMTYRGPPICA